ncbi:MAG: glycosyltransferase [Burkholderiales bacterium]|nr:glycosyltransferase [Burkholderiales bacterium]
MNGNGRPRLAYVVNSLHPGGTERLVVDMSRAFGADYEIEVICLDEPGAWADTLRQSGIAVYCLWRQGGLDLSMPVRLARHFRRSRPDIVHTHQCTPWFYAALSRLLYARPRLLLEEHGRFYPEADKPLRRLLNRWLVRHLTHRFVAVSADIRERLVRYEGLNHSQIEVIYNGVKPVPAIDETARAHRRAQLGFSERDFVVGTVGRFDPIKNLPMLVGALAAARRQHDDVRGLLVGDGPIRGDVERLAASSTEAGSIVFTGHREDARTLVQCLDLFVLASFSEGTSMALLEAMSAGVPVAVTAVGGNPEIVVDGATGWLLPSGDEHALAEAISQARTDAIVRRERGLAGMRRFSEHFSFDAMIERYGALYAQLLPNGGLAATRAKI